MFSRVLFLASTFQHASREIRYVNAIMHNKYSRAPEKIRAIHLDLAPARKKKDRPLPTKP